MQNYRKAYRFMGMDYAVSHGMRIDASDYNFVYSGQMTEDDTLDRLYERFNIEHPGDYTGYSLSVSDVIVLQEEQRMKAYYVDSFGYRELPDFLRQRQEMLNTDDLITNQTRGTAVEGHFGTWHTVEEKEIAGETFFRMEHDEYGDSVAGIIVNTDGKLVAEDLEHGFDVGAMEAITEYLYEKVPEPFIKQFYVVNDAYGVKAEREYQYFENLDEAIQAYHLLPNHLDKQLGMESREPVTSRMPLISCKNGIEEEGFIVIAGFLRIGSSGALISYDTTDFHIEGKEGSWLAYDSIIIDGREFFLMEHTVYGAQTANVVLDSEGKLVADNVFHGFDETVKQQIREYLHPPIKEPEPEKSKKPMMENWQKAYENGEYLRSAEITEEQNYNMIDGRMNNLPNKHRKIGGRISVLDRLHLKQAEIARRSGKAVPQMAAEEMERRRK